MLLQKWMTNQEKQTSIYVILIVQKTFLYKLWQFIYIWFI
jgi:hypothetical protein